MTTGLRLFILSIVLCALPGCIEPRLAPFVDVHKLAPQIDPPRGMAEQGNADDQYHLGLWYEKTVPHDYAEALRWYRQAAIQRQPDAFYRLCVLSNIGRGVPQDYQEALRWCRLAADRGHAQAMFIIGIHYHEAKGVARDWVQAHQWYNLAAANGYDAGIKWRDRLAYVMTPAQIAQAQFLARNWKPQTPEPNALGVH